MPALTRMCGYFPGRVLRLGEDLPRQAALDWAERRQPDLVANADQRRRFGPWMTRYERPKAATLALSVTDDAFAPPAAAERLLAMYPNLSVERRVVAPADVGARRLGHLCFIRRDTGPFFADLAADWLFDRTSLRDASHGRPRSEAVGLPVPATRAEHGGRS
jgi:predicted alpha/beta hydrolase